MPSPKKKPAVIGYSAHTLVVEIRFSVPSEFIYVFLTVFLF